MKKIHWVTPFAATALVLNGCNNSTVNEASLKNSNLKIAGSCTNIDTETDSPIVIAFDPENNAIYFGLADSPLKYDVSHVDDEFVTAEQRDETALYASYKKSEKIRVNLKTGEIASISVGSTEGADSSKSYAPTAACTWFADAAYGKAVSDSKAAFTARTPSYLSQLVESRKKYEQTQKDSSTPSVESDPFPFTAVMSCGINGFENINLAACLGGDVGTEIEINNGDSYGMYKAYNIPQDWQTTDRGVEIPLQRNFSIKMQNSSESLIMGLRIFDNNGKILFQKQAAQWGTIRIQN